MADKRKQIVLAEITQLINSIKEQTDELNGKEHIPQIELDFICEKISRLHERSIILNFLNTFEEEPLPTNKDLTHHTPLPETSPELAIKTEAQDDVLTERIEIDENSNPVMAITKEENTAVVYVSDITPEAKEEPEVNESFASEIFQIPEDSETQIVKLNRIADPKKPPIANLKSAISINQRLQFINNLFKGNVDLMNRSLEDLNNLNSLKQAEQKLNELISQLSWNTEYELFLSFKELIERRYS